MARKKKVEAAPVATAHLTAEEVGALRAVVAVYGADPASLRGPCQLSVAEAATLIETGDVAHLADVKRERVRALVARWLAFGEDATRKAAPCWLLIQARVLAGLSTLELAKGAGLGETLLQTAESGRSIPDVRTLLALFDFYRAQGWGWLHLEDLLDETTAGLRARHAAALVDTAAA